MLKLITLDLDNTLWNVTPTLIQAEKILFAWVSGNIPQALPFYQRDNLQLLRKQFSEQYPDRTKFPTHIRKYVLEACFLQAGLSSKQAKEKTQEAFSIFIKARNNVDLFPETLDILQQLSAKYDIIALTNGNADLALIGIKQYFTAHYSAETIGKAKPDPSMFMKALETTNCKPENTLHIGDHPSEDIEAATRLGINTIWFNPDQTHDSSLCKPTVEINTLDALLTQVERIHQNEI